MANQISFRKVSVLPETFEPSTFYLVSNPSDTSLFDIYLSSSTGATIKHIITKSEINSMIVSALAGFSTAQVVANIAARNALNPTVITQALVIDATGDPTVASGSATYVYDVANSTWIKISESESLDIVLKWANIEGRPNSAVADIDDAVAKKHEHGNKNVIDALSDAGGLLQYKGAPIRAFLDEETW